LKNNPLFIILLFGMFALLQTGCAEGPLWKTGRFFPWSQKKWKQDEQIAETVYAKRDRLRSMGRRAKFMDEAEQQQAVAELAEMIRSEKTLIVRLEAVRALGKIPLPSASSVLEEALNEPEADLRVTAIQSMRNRHDPSSVAALQKVIGSDSDTDVRREAIRSLADYEGPEVVQALGLALNENDPAIQYLAMQSLREVTREDLGADVNAWRQFVNGEPVTTESSEEQLAKRPSKKLF
jgi:HEAT repeats